MQTLIARMCAAQCMFSSKINYGQKKKFFCWPTPTFRPLANPVMLVSAHISAHFIDITKISKRASPTNLMSA